MGILKLKRHHVLTLLAGVLFICFALRWRYGASNYEVVALVDTNYYVPSELCEKGRPDGAFKMGSTVDIISVEYYKECMFFIARLESGKRSALLSDGSVRINKKTQGWDYLRFYPKYGVIEDYYQFQQRKLKGKKRGV